VRRAVRKVDHGERAPLQVCPSREPRLHFERAFPRLPAGDLGGTDDGPNVDRDFDLERYPFVGIDQHFDRRAHALRVRAHGRVALLRLPELGEYVGFGHADAQALGRLAGKAPVAVLREIDGVRQGPRVAVKADADDTVVLSPTSTPRSG